MLLMGKLFLAQDTRVTRRFAGAPSRRACFPDGTHALACTGSVACVRRERVRVRDTGLVAGGSRTVDLSHARVEASPSDGF